MDSIGASGVIFAFVVVLWAAYVLPLALRRYDESERKLPVGAMGSFSRVIRKSEPAPRQEIVVDVEAAPGSRIKPKLPKPKIGSAAGLRAKDGQRPSARKAARRRRMVLYVLLLPLSVVGILAGIAVVPAWTPAVPAGLVVAWLVICRFQVRIERRLTRGAPKKAGAIDADFEQTVIVNRDDVEPERKNVMERDVPLEADALEEKLQIAVPSTSTQGEVQWDPLPVTLPTYVTKPRAGRTVRTIDFDQPGTWTSGHIEGEQTDLPAAEAKKDDGHQEAVGH